MPFPKGRSNFKESQMRLFRALEHGWKPTNKKISMSKETAHKLRLEGDRIKAQREVLS
jgi:hypothetical protein